MFTYSLLLCLFVVCFLRMSVRNTLCQTYFGGSGHFNTGVWLQPSFWFVNTGVLHWVSGALTLESSVKSRVRDVNTETLYVFRVRRDTGVLQFRAGWQGSFSVSGALTQKSFTEFRARLRWCPSISGAMTRRKSFRVSGAVTQKSFSVGRGHTEVL